MSTNISNKKFGEHYIIEFTGCPPERLKEVSIVKDFFLKAAQKSKATILKSHFHQFKPNGVSGVLLIAESHFTIHTWPAEGYAAVDIFTCGDTMDACLAIKEMKTLFNANKLNVKKIARGPN